MGVFSRYVRRGQFLSIKGLGGGGRLARSSPLGQSQLCQSSRVLFLEEARLLWIAEVSVVGGD